MPPELRPYQREAVRFLQEHHNGAGLFLDMGLGKTAISLSALEERHLPAVVIAPKRVAEEVWPEETGLWRPDLTIEVAAGTPAKRKAILHGDADIVALCRNNIADLEEIASSGKYKTLIIDELSSFKSRGKWWKSARRIRKHMQFVWGLTGTPTPNGYLDLWPQILLLDGGERLGTSITAFRNRYFIPKNRLNSGIVTEWELRPGARGRILELIEDLCLSMSTDGRVELPPVTHNIVDIPMSTKVKKIYNKMRDELVVNLDILGGEVHTASNAAVLSGKLSQITSGFIYPDDADIRNVTFQPLHDEKTNAVKEIVEGTGSPILVFYHFQAELQRLKKSLGKLAHTIDEPGIMKKWNAGEVPVLLAHPQSAGHGLNLQHGGHTIVWVTQPWSLEEYQQANKRLARSGQTHPVMIHHLNTPKSIDEAILQRLEGKSSVQQALLKYLESPL